MGHRPHSTAFMTDSLPTWTRFAASTPPSLPDEPGRIVAVVASPSTEAWAPSVAVRLARAWGRNGRRVVLFDGGISAPTLHDEVGRDNDEGLTDAVLYGASVGRVARRVGGEPMFFVPAGTAVADPAGVLRHERWSGMCRGFLQAGATLVVFVPRSDASASQAMVDATDVVVLAAPDDDVADLVGASSSKVRAVVGAEHGGDAADAGLGLGAGDEAEVDVGPGPVGNFPVGDGFLADESDELFRTDDDGNHLVDRLELADEGETVGPDDRPSATADRDVSPDTDETSSATADADFLTDTDETPSDAPDGDEGSDDGAWAYDSAGGDGHVLTGAQTEEEGAPAAFDDSSRDLERDVVFGEAAGETSSPEPDSTEKTDALGESGRDDSARKATDAYVTSDAGTGGRDYAAGVAPGGEAEAPPPVPTADEIIAEVEAARAAPTEERVAAAFDVAQEKKTRNPLPAILMLLFLVALAVAGWWFGLIAVPGLVSPGVTAPPLDGAVPSTTPGDVAPVARSQAMTPPAAFSIVLESYRDEGVARRRAAELAARVPDRVWAVAPVLVDGSLFHRVIVGPAADEVGAESLSQSVAGIIGGDRSRWMVRPTPKAFLLGEVADRGEAQNLVGSLSRDGIFAYVLRATAREGDATYRIYAGAYADESEAAHMASLLAERGLPVTLVDRAGVAP